jgi:hypothetical protein
MSNSWGGGGSLVTMPTSPVPAKLELGKQVLAAANSNPFTGQQQIQNWQANYAVGSCTLPPMDAADGQNWQYFLDQCNGIVNVFQFMPALAADTRYFYWLVTNGMVNGPQKYFRMMKNDYRVSISPGGIYRLSFEFREAI